MAVNVKKAPQINAIQMADIAFIMLIFFMMVTTMGSEYGLIRMLPPWVPPDFEQADRINERNILQVNINSLDQMQVNKQIIDVSELRARTKEFFDIRNVGDNYPEKDHVDFPLVGSVYVNTTAVVSLQNDRATSYRLYIQAQNEISAAINELRDEFTRQRFGSSFEASTQEQQDVATSIYRMAISEAEPRDRSRSR